MTICNTNCIGDPFSVVGHKCSIANSWLSKCHNRNILVSKMHLELEDKSIKCELENISCIIWQMLHKDMQDQ